jgi:Xaa-Pro dipeptidase
VPPHRHDRLFRRLPRRRLLEGLVAAGAWACGTQLPANSASTGDLSSPPGPPLTPRPPIPPLSDASFTARLDRVRSLAKDAGADLAVVTSGTTNFAYLAGAPVERSERLIALFVPVEGEATLLAPSFEVERVRRAVRVRAALVGWEESRSPFDVVRDTLGARAHGAVLVEPHTEYGTAAGLAHAFPDTKLVDGAAAFDSLRVVKDAEEIARIRRAIAITEDAFARAFDRLAPGVRDRDVAASIRADFEREGVGGYALVQFGALSALPHGHPVGAPLTPGTAVLIDGGCTVDGYESDITRTRWFGSEPPAEYVKITDVVREAQHAGIARAREGVEAQEVDRAARAVITRAGYGPYFTHRTGHGLGMDGHEPIYMVEGNRAPLVQGCVFTIEPGIYLPARFGVRIEDDVCCGADGAAVLTGA